MIDIKFIKVKFILAMLIFGSIGIFIKSIELPSQAIVQWRTIIGSIFLLLILITKGRKLDLESIKKNMLPLIIAGIVLGANWAFMFQAFEYTPVGVVTLLYYSAPVIVFFLSPIIFKEKILPRQLLGITAAIVGMLIINKVSRVESGLSLGILYALISALFYAVLMISNKFIRDIDGVTSTFIQLFVAMIVMTIYIFITTKKLIYIPQGRDIILIAIVGVVHTGIAFYMYISSMQYLKGQNISILSYIDPASALIFAFMFLGEKLTPYGIFGAALILGGTLYSQISYKIS
nr:DMT family transporter [Tissierella sp.]